MDRDDEKSQEQINEIQVEILQNTAMIDERTRKMEAEIELLRDKYTSEFVEHEGRVALIESRTNRHDVIISGSSAVFLIFLAALLTHLTGVLALFSFLW